MLHLWLHLGICHTTETRYSISYLQHSECGMCWMSWDQTRVTAEYIESSECLCTRMGLAVLLHDVECKHTDYLAIKWSQLHHADTMCGICILIIVLLPFYVCHFYTSGDIYVCLNSFKCISLFSIVSCAGTVKKPSSWEWQPSVLGKPQSNDSKPILPHLDFETTAL